jgi:glutathione S-transferase
MKLYEDRLAPNPRHVRIFLAEKGIEVPTEQVSIMAGAHKEESFRRISPMALLPALELDDGRVITESVAICRYFEELRPDPPLMGTDPFTKASIEMWQRRMEQELLIPIAMTYRHTNPAMKALEEQIAPFGEVNRRRAERRIGLLDHDLGETRYIAGDTYSIADITAMVALDFGKAARIAVPETAQNVKRWYAEVSSRPSAAA